MQSVKRWVFTRALPSLRLGGNDVGQLGRPNNLAVTETILEDQAVQLASCGMLHSLVLTRNEGALTMYSFGKAAGARLGNGNDIDDCFEPHAAFTLEGREAPKAISAGSMHNCLVTADGQLFGWGYDSHGQVGCLGDPSQSTSSSSRLVHRPTLIHGSEKFKSVSCSGFHTAAISQQNKLLAWGRSDFGRCGVQNTLVFKGEDDTVPVWLPRQVENVPEVSLVAAGGFFTVAVDVPGKNVFSFGGNGNGELGIGKKSKAEFQPQQVVGLALDTNERITNIASGGFHTNLLTSSGRVLSFGDNHSNQLGLTGAVKFSAVPVQLDVITERCIQVEAGPVYTVVVTESNKVYLVGNTPKPSEPELIYDGGKYRVTLASKQGAHHIIFMVDV